MARAKRTKRRLTNHVRTLAGLMRMGSGTFTAQDAHDKVRANAALAKSPLGIRASAYISRFIREFLHEGLLVIAEDGRLRSSPQARRRHREIEEKLAGEAFDSDAAKYYALCAYLYAEFAPAHKLTKSQLLDEVQHLRRLHRQDRKHSAELARCGPSSHADVAAGTSGDEVLMQNDSGPSNAFASPVRRSCEELRRAEQAYPSPASAPRPTLRRVPSVPASSPPPLPAPAFEEDPMDVDPAQPACAACLAHADALRIAQEQHAAALRGMQDELAGQQQAAETLRGHVCAHERTIEEQGRALTAKDRTIGKRDDALRERDAACTALRVEIAETQQRLAAATTRAEEIEVERNVANGALVEERTAWAAELARCNSAAAALQNELDQKNTTLRGLAALGGVLANRLNAAAGST